MEHYLIRCSVCGKMPKLKTIKKGSVFVATVCCRKRLLRPNSCPTFSAEAQDSSRAEFYAALAWNQYMSGLSQEDSNA